MITPPPSLPSRRLLRRAFLCLAFLAFCLGWPGRAPADDAAPATVEVLLREIEALKRRVAELEESDRRRREEIDVERLIVRRELVVSDTGQPWEAGFEEHQIPRGIYAKSVGDGVGGLWVRSRLIKGEIDDPFDDRFHALERDGSRRGSPGHVSWNIWLDGAWRQLAIIQGEALEPSEVPTSEWSGGNHPGRLRFQSFRPHHDEPLTDAVIGQGKMSLGGGGFGGGGLPYPDEVLEIWGGEIVRHSSVTPGAPAVVGHDGSGETRYAVVAVGVQGRRTPASPETTTDGRAQLQWDSVPGADAYIVVRDGVEVTDPLRIEGSQKEWTDPEMKANTSPPGESPGVVRDKGVAEWRRGFSSDSRREEGVEPAP